MNATKSHAGEVRHTPLPWSVSLKAAGGNRTYGICTDAVEFKDDEHWPYHPLVASVYRGHGHAPLEIAQANAAFIVKACNAHDELVEALSRFRFLMKQENWSFDERDAKLESHLEEIVIPLLAKAKGGAS